MSNTDEFHIPKLKIWQKFESLTKDFAESKNPNILFNKYGRTGQKQEGIDIYGSRKDGKIIVFQCKNHKSKISIENIEKEVKKIDANNFPVYEINFATSADRDAKIQTYIINENLKRLPSKLPELKIFFWDDFENFISTNESIYSKYMPSTYSKADLLRKERDIRSIEGILNYVDLDDAISSSQSYPDRISSRFIDSYECLAIQYENALSKPHNETLNSKFMNLITVWGEAINAAPAYYNQGPSIYYYIIDRKRINTENEALYMELLSLRPKLIKEINSFVEYIKENYIEVDTLKTTRHAKKWHSDIENEFSF